MRNKSEHTTYALLTALINNELLLAQELFKVTEELEAKKADKQMVESEIVSGFKDSIWPLCNRDVVFKQADAACCLAS